MKKYILFIVGFSCLASGIEAQQIAQHAITGTVLSSKDGTPLPGASLYLKNSKTSAISASGGDFSLNITTLPDTLVISRIGYKKAKIVIVDSAVSPLTITMDISNTALQQITVSTGYQNIPKERATGSFDFIDNKLLNRSVSPDILSRLKGVTSGLLFDRSAGNDLNISIRGRSTLF